MDAPRALDDGSEFAGRDGVLTGEVREMGAILTVLDAIPDPPGPERFARVRRVLDRLHAVGITGVHAMDGSPANYDFLAELEARDELTMRMVVPLWEKPDTSDDDLRAQLPLLDAHGRLWRGGVAKFFVDGVIESGTAWLEEPDTLGAGTQALWQPAERYEEAVRLFAGAKFQCVTRAIGRRGRAARRTRSCPRRVRAPPRTLARVARDDGVGALVAHPEHRAGVAHAAGRPAYSKSATSCGPTQATTGGPEIPRATSRTSA